MAVGGVSSGAIRKFTSHHLPLRSVFNLSTAETHPKFAFHHLPFSSTIIIQWRKEFLDGRYGSKQPTPPFTPRTSSLSFPIPVIVGNRPQIQQRQQPLPLRDVLQFDHLLPHGPPNHPNPPRVLEVIRRLREWRGRPQDPRRPPQWMN
ncbi:hypothetical protein niasHT_010917 [Heterodera trifolii]|uniref:Uncharacterized protein n=1 Tax=Heterodera trifolii TaxID=157864 RepID=A0ABD2LG40_9BILA